MIFCGGCRFYDNSAELCRINPPERGVFQSIVFGDNSVINGGYTRSTDGWPHVNPSDCCEKGEVGSIKYSLTEGAE